MTHIGGRSLKLTILISIAVCFGISLMPSRPVSALSGSDFQAGHIIDDYVFTNTSSMSVQDIQNFLNSKVTTCSTNHAGYTGGTGTTYNPPFVCLKDFYENPNSTYTVGFSYTDTNGNPQTGSRTYYNNNAYKVTALCPVYRGYSGTPTCGSGDYHNGLDHLIPTLQTSGLGVPSGAQSAAQIIYNAAQQYNINPQVLIVLLQKEQGLVTDDWPAFYEYQTAAGYGCPDTAPCSSNYAGFSNQVISAAWQFRQYMNYPNNYNYVVGNNYIQYNPVASCGGSTVNIQNQATAALYDYTPYQPNAAALSVVSDTSAGGTVPCGAYGNRNFWWYFTEWFGTTYTSTYSAQPVWQQVYTDASKSTSLGWNATLLPGQTAWAVVVMKNTGNTTWTHSGGPGTTDTRLVTYGPWGRQSAFCTNAWIPTSPSCTRPVAVSEASVAPGQTGTFEFPIQAPSKTGMYNEAFSPIVDGKATFSSGVMNFQLDVVPPVFSAQPVWQQVYTDASKSTSLGWNASLMTGQSAYAVVAMKNTGNTTWTKSGAFGTTDTRLATYGPWGRSSPFCDGSWLINCTRPAALQENSVAPGQTGTFEFSIRAPGQQGAYTETFSPVVDGRTIFSNGVVAFNFMVTPAIFSAQPVWQQVYTDASKSTSLGWNATLTKGQTAYLVVGVRNTGNVTWTRTGAFAITDTRLATYGPWGRSSPFCDGSWLINCTRPSALTEATVAPGAIGTFEFPIQAPGTAGTYTESFSPVIDGRTTFSGSPTSFILTIQ